MIDNNVYVINIYYHKFILKILNSELLFIFSCIPEGKFAISVIISEAQ